MEIFGIDLNVILTLVMFLVTTFFGAQWRKFKAVLKKVVEAAEDDTITAEEVQGIIKTWNETKKI